MSRDNKSLPKTVNVSIVVASAAEQMTETRQSDGENATHY